MSDKPDDKHFIPGGYSGTDGVDFFVIDNKKGYDGTIIGKIPDLEGGKRSERNIPTAIPSPFARFDLVAAAFTNIAETKELRAEGAGTKVKASKDDERLVSHTLDLAEIIFDRSKYGSALSISSFNCRDGVKELLGKNLSIGYKRFLKSLELYLEEDAETYNFGYMDDIFLFKYKNVVIGSTSPVTFFCPTANNLLDPDSGDYTVIKLEDQREAFSENFKPLYERSPEFQKWFHFLIELFRAEARDESLPHKAIEALEGLDAYAKQNEECLRINQKDDSKKAEVTSFIDNIREVLRNKDKEELYNRFQTDYGPLEAQGANSKVKILNVEVYIKKEEEVGKVLQYSDFCIVSEKYKNSSRYAKTNKTMPLVLPNNFNLTGWKYAASEFVPNTPVPLYVGGTYDQPREMPGLGMKGHYLTVSDFLEPYIIRTIYPISEKFYVGGPEKGKNPVDKSGRGYLLPLKKEFFDFFNREDLISGGNGIPRKPKITVVPQNDKDESVKVTLKIPVVKSGNQYITFEKIYKSGQFEQKNNDALDGGIIVTKPFGLTIFPFVRPDSDLKKVFEKYKILQNYMVQLVDSEKTEKAEYALDFYSATNEKLEIHRDNRRFDKRKDPASSNYYELQKEFEYIQISQTTMNGDDLKALIIPEWQDVGIGGTRYVFAVDFGTTNTHIAYTKGDDTTTIPFNVTGDDNDIQIVTLFDEKKEMSEKQSQAEKIILSEYPDIIELINKEFVPRAIGGEDGNIFVFPQRTAIAYNLNMPKTKWDDGLDTLTESNIPFGYEKIEQIGDAIKTNLKWMSKGETKQISQDKAKSYLRELIMLMRNKVLANGGDLMNTKLIWFYPSSMTVPEEKGLRMTWEKEFYNYFGKEKVDSNGEPRVVKVVESLAPYIAQRGLLGDQKGWTVSIDIGGGTTDVAIFENRIPFATTSFKFAGNALFGDAYTDLGRGAKKNGFVITLVEKYRELLEGYPKPKRILEELVKTECAADINAFLFSVENNIEYWTKKKVDRERYSFSTMIELHGQDLKFLILYFFVALMYHIAQLLKSIEEEKGVSINLKAVMFSGTASKILKVLADDENLSMLIKHIFDDLKLKTDEITVKELAPDPKILTCVGGLLLGSSSERDKLKVTPDQNYVYTCIRGIDKSVKYSEYFEDVKNKDESKIKTHLIDFHKSFFALNKKMDFSEYFGIENKVTNYVKSIYEKLIREKLDSAVAAALALDDIVDTSKEVKKEEENNDNNATGDNNNNVEDGDDNNVAEDDGVDKVKETPFFMPLKDMMLDISYDIAKKKYENRG